MSKHQELLDYIDDLEVGKKSVYEALPIGSVYLTVQLIGRSKKHSPVALSRLMIDLVRHALQRKSSVS